MTKSERIKIKRQLQNSYHEKYTHPKEKTEQIKSVLEDRKYFKILELFAGEGNLSKVYEEYLYKGYGNQGKLYSYDIKTTKEDSFLLFHKFIYQQEKFDIIDIDPFGYPSKFFPDIFMLIDNGFLFLTFCKPNKVYTSSHLGLHLKCYFGNECPRLDNVLTSVKKYSNFHWKDANVMHVLDLPGVWRIAFSVSKVSPVEFSWGKVGDLNGNSKG